MSTYTGKTADESGKPTGECFIADGLFIHWDEVRIETIIRAVVNELESYNHTETIIKLNEAIECLGKEI